MDDNDKKIQRIMYEAERLNENQIFQEYIKIKKIMVHGQQIENIIRQKMMLSKKLIAEQKRRMEEEKTEVDYDSADLIDMDDSQIEEPEQLQQPQQVRGRPPIVQQRNKSLQQQQAQQRQPSQQKEEPKKETFGFNKDELGIDDLNVDGLPEFEDDN